VVVIDEAGRPIGVLDERDIVLEWPPGPLAAHHLPVHRLLRFRPRPHVHESDHVATAARTMLEARVDALPVADEDGTLTGLLTARGCLPLIARPCPPVTPQPARPCQRRRPTAPSGDRQPAGTVRFETRDRALAGLLPLVGPSGVRAR